MFLRVLHESTMLCTCKCASTTHCGTFTIFKRIHSSTWHLDLIANIKVHPIYHVNRFKELLGYGDNLVSIKTLVTFDNLASKPHKLERILDSKL